MGVRGAGGTLGRAAARRAAGLGHEVITTPSSDVDVVVRADPPAAWEGPLEVPSVGAALAQTAASDTVTLPAGGWWGGLGALLTAAALEGAADPREAHVAYGLPGGVRALARSSGTLRQALLRAAMADGMARVDGRRVSEPLAAGRRLAWFPRPMGPAHAAAVGGLEQFAPLDVPTLRTWVAVGSFGAELLQALGRRDPRVGVGRWLLRRAARGPGGDTATVRWAVLAEVLDGNGEVVRAWANGTDPVAAAADLMVVAAVHLAEGSHGTVPTTVLDLGPCTALLDELADLQTLRWSIARPEPSPR